VPKRGEHKTIEVIARGACVRAGRLLVCHSKGASNTYLPGGHVEFGEGAKEALCRELKEELGRPARAGRLLGVVEHTFVQEGRRHCEVNLVFELRVSGISVRRLPPSCEAAIEFRWVDLERLVEARLEPRVLRRRLAGWLQGDGGGERWGSSLG